MDHLILSWALWLITVIAFTSAVIADRIAIAQIIWLRRRTRAWIVMTLPSPANTKAFGWRRRQCWISWVEWLGLFLSPSFAGFRFFLLSSLNAMSGICYVWTPFQRPPRSGTYPFPILRTSKSTLKYSCQLTPQVRRLFQYIRSRYTDCLRVQYFNRTMRGQQHIPWDVENLPGRIGKQI